MQKLTRISFNSGGWEKPTKEDQSQESGRTFNSEFGFGNEDWLFRDEWLLGGWRYAFVQGVNKNPTYEGAVLDLTLFTMHPPLAGNSRKRHRFVAEIQGAEVLNDDEAKEAFVEFQELGWFQTMQQEVGQIGGDIRGFCDPQWAKVPLNIRFRTERVRHYPPDSFASADPWLLKRWRYELYRFDVEGPRIKSTFFKERRELQTALATNHIFRRGSYAVEVDPLHAKMQEKLLGELQARFGVENVLCEKDFIDLKVQTKTETILYEIKSDLEPREVIRRALGQVLEYAYNPSHPSHPHPPPIRLVIVGRRELGPNEQRYLDQLKTQFSLPLEYIVVAI